MKKGSALKFFILLCEYRKLTGTIWLHELFEISQSKANSKQPPEGFP